MVSEDVDTGGEDGLMEEPTSYWWCPECRAKVRRPVFHAFKQRCRRCLGKVERVVYCPTCEGLHVSTECLVAVVAPCQSSLGGV